MGIQVRHYGLKNPLRAFENINKRGNATERTTRAGKKKHEAGKSQTNDGWGFSNMFKR